MSKPTYYLWRNDFSSQEEFEPGATTLEPESEVYVVASLGVDSGYFGKCR